MAPAARDDMGIEAHIPNLMNGQNSSFHRQFSESLHVPSVRKSIWCGKYFQTPGIDETSHGEDFDQQTTPINHSIVKISMYDGVDDTNDTDDDEGVDGDEEGDYVSDEDELEGEADEQQGEDEGDEENEETEAGVEDAGEQEQIEYDIDFIAEPEGQDRNMTAEYGPYSIMEEELTAENGVDLFGEEDAESTAGEEVEFTAGDGMEGKPKGLDDEFVGEPEANKIRGLSEEQEHASVEKRLASLWNIHKVINFSTDYDDGIVDLDYSWDCTFRQSKRLKKRNSADIPNRPNPYERDTVLKGDFLQITPVERFLEQLRNPETKSYDELYSITSNVAHALKVWQDEYLAIDHLSKMASRQAMRKTVNPRKAENRQVFEDKKEATLYGYKHDPRDSRVGIQDPFVQGGFKPTTTQLRKGKTSVSADNLNPDRWPPIFKFGMEHVPRFQDLPKIPGEIKQTRKRKAAQMEAANSANETNEVAESTPVVGTENDIEPPAKRQTRFSGGKRPSAQETPQAASNPPGHRATTGHGRGTSARGSFGRESASRGISNHKASAASKGPSRGASDRTASNRGGSAPGGGAPGRKASGRGTPNRSTPVRGTPLRGNPGRESSNRKPLVRSGQKHKASITPQSSQPSPVTPARSSARIPARKSQVNSVSPSSSLQARPAANKSVATAPSTPNENPAPTTTISVSASDTTAANDSIPATSSPPATTPATSPSANGDDSVDSMELARRQKIANSKNPKRTEAMLNHWEKFNREGRTRNPKRTRAQIEAARSAEAHKKATESTKPSPKKRKNAEATTNDEPPTKSIKTESPMLAPIQPTLAPASAIPAAAPALAPAPPPPLTLTPALPQYPTIEPRGVVPHYPPLAPNLSPMAPSFPTLAPNPPPLTPNPPTLAPNHPPLGPTPPPLGPAPSLSHLAPSAPHPMAYPPHGYPTEYYVHYGAPPLILSPHHRGDHTSLI